MQNKNFHLQTQSTSHILRVRKFNVILFQSKNPPKWWIFRLVGDKGLEPSTSRSQTARASQLRQSPNRNYNNRYTGLNKVIYNYTNIINRSTTFCRIKNHTV